MSGTRVWNPSTAHTNRPHQSGVGSSTPATRWNNARITFGPSRRRHPVSTFAPGTRHARRHGTCGSTPTRRAITSGYDASGNSVIASTNRVTNANDMHRRRTPGLAPHAGSPTNCSITPSPRCCSRIPSRTWSGSHPSACTRPSRRTTAAAVTTGEQNTIASPDTATAPADTTAPSRPPRPDSTRSATRTATIPAGGPTTGMPSSATGCSAAGNTPAAASSIAVSSPDR